MYKQLMVVLISCVFSISSAYAECTNVVINHSQAPWTIKFPDYQPLPVARYLALPNGYTATIPPGTSLQVRLFNTVRSRGLISSYIDIADKNGVMYRFYFYNLDHYCPYISHKGSTGSVSLNSPSKGDITIEKDLWGIDDVQ